MNSFAPPQTFESAELESKISFHPKASESSYTATRLQKTKNNLTIKNVINETFKTGNIYQKLYKSINSFVNELKQQSILCDFKCECEKLFEEKIFKDRLILGLNDKDIQQRLLLVETIILNLY